MSDTCDRCDDDMPARITERVSLCFDCYDYMGQLNNVEADHEFATTWMRPPLNVDRATVLARCRVLFRARRRRLTEDRAIRSVDR